MTETKPQNEHIKIGEVNTLKIERDTDFGYCLAAKDYEEVLLPNVYIMEDEMPMGSLLDVFVYTDSEDRPVATTKMPYAKLGNTVTLPWWITSPMAPLSTGDFPNSSYRFPSRKSISIIGKKYLLRVCLDEQTGRLYGTQKIGKYFNREMKGLHQNKVLDAIVLAQTPLGYKVIADKQYEGMLFPNEIFEPVKVGDRKKVYIKTVRKDGKLDLSLQPIGKQAKIGEAEGTILQFLKEVEGELPFTYKSDAEEIKKVFGMSKKNFKRTPALIEEGQIVVLENSIKLA